MKLSALSALALMPLVSAALLPRQDPRVNYPDLPLCFGVCFQSSVMNTCGPTDIACFCSSATLVGKLSECIVQECKSPADVQKAAEFGVAFCQAGGITITPSLDSVIADPTGSSVIADPTTTTAGNGIGTIPAGESTLIAVDKTTDLAPGASTVADPASTSGAAPARTDSVSTSPVAPTSVAATVSKATGVSSAASVPVSSAAVTAPPSNGAGGLVVPCTGVLAGLLAVVFAM